MYATFYKKHELTLIIVKEYYDTETNMRNYLEWAPADSMVLKADLIKLKTNVFWLRLNPIYTSVSLQHSEQVRQSAKNNTENVDNAHFHWATPYGSWRWHSWVRCDLSHLLSPVSDDEFKDKLRHPNMQQFQNPCPQTHTHTHTHTANSSLALVKLTVGTM